jgi:hypothetical protein
MISLQDYFLLSLELSLPGDVAIPFGEGSFYFPY